MSGQIESLGFPLARWHREACFLPETLFARDQERFLESCRAAAGGHPSVGRYRISDAAGGMLPFQLALDSLRHGDTLLLRGQMAGLAPEQELSSARAGPRGVSARDSIIARFDPELRHTYVSPSIQQLVGLPAVAFLGRTNEELGMPPRLARRWNERILRTFRRAEPQEVEFRLLLGDGRGHVRPVSFQSRLVPELGPGGEVSSVLSVAQVVSAHRSDARSSPASRSEASGSLSTPLADGPRVPRARALTAQERLEWLTRVGRTLASHLDKKELFRAIEALALPLLGDRGGVELIREWGLERMASFPATPEVERGPWGRSFPFVTCALHAGRAQLLSGPSELVLHAAAQDEEHLRQLKDEGLQALMVVPLLRGGETYGCLWFAATDPARPLGADELALAEHLALLVSPAVDAARLRRIEREIRQRETLLEKQMHALRQVASALGEALLPAQVASAVMGEVRRALSAMAAVVYQVDASGTAVELLQASGYGSAVTRPFERVPLTLRSPVTEAVRRREGIWVGAGEEFRRDYPELAARLPGPREGAWVALPLIVEGRILGVLAFSFDSAHAFSPEERAFSLALAQLCAQSLERARLYRQLQTRIEEFQTLLDVLPVGIGIARDRECLHIAQNPALARMLGTPLEQNASLGAPEPERMQGVRALHHGRELEPDELPLQLAAATGRPVYDFELELALAGRPPATVLSFAAPLFDKDRRPRGAIGAFLDITERKRAIEAQHFLVESSAALSSSLDPERTVLAVTRLCIPTLGSLALLYEESGEGLSLVSCAHQERQLEQLVIEAARQGRLLAEPLVRRVLESGQPLLVLDVAEALGEVSQELHVLVQRLALRSLTLLPLHSRKWPASILVCGSREGDGEVDFRVARDFAERAALAMDNARLYQEAREAIALREQFLAVAGHELKTPLTALRLSLESLARQGLKAEPAKLTKRIEQCQGQSVRLGRLVDALLDVGRLATGRLPLVLEELELVLLVEDIVAPLALQFEKAECVVSSELHGPIVGRWDRTRLEQVLTNLLGNAAKYGRGQPIELAVFATPEHAVIRVRDHGIGIAPEDQARIFQRFERAVPERHYGGLGLGLWISRGLVTLMGGRIEVQSAPGQGATFTVYLPRP